MVREQLLRIEDLELLTSYPIFIMLIIAKVNILQVRNNVQMFHFIFFTNVLPGMI